MGGTHKAGAQFPALFKAVVTTPVNPELPTEGQEGQKFKVVLGCTASLRQEMGVG